MIWAGICWRGKTPLASFQESMDAVAYVEILASVLDPFVEEKYPKGLFSTRQCFRSHCEALLRLFYGVRSTCPKDIIPIEKIWAFCRALSTKKSVNLTL